jgi:hypothetical protein
MGRPQVYQHGLNEPSLDPFRIQWTIPLNLLLFSCIGESFLPFLEAYCPPLQCRKVTSSFISYYQSFRFLLYSPCTA